MRTNLLPQKLRVARMAEPNRAMLSLWAKTQWGDRGSRYQIPHMEQRLAALGETFYYACYFQDRLIGAYVLSPRSIHCGSEIRRAVYRTGFTMDEAFRGRGFGHFFAAEVRKRLLAEASDTAFSYGFVDGQNNSSLAVLQSQGYRKLGSFQPLVFFRHRPKPLDGLQALGSELSQNPQRENNLKNRYSLLCSEAGNTKHRKFFQYEELPVRVGVQKVELRLCSWGQLWGRLFLRLGSRLPVLKKFLGRQGFSLLFFDAPEYPPGRAAEFLALLEGILNHFRLSMGLLFLDTRGVEFDALRRHPQWGWISRILPSESVHVLGDSLAGATPGLLEEISQKPLYIRAADVL